MAKGLRTPEQLARHREAQRAYRARNPEARKDAKKRWSTRNPEKVQEYRRRWKEANPAKVAEARRAWKSANPDKMREYRAASRLKARYAHQPASMTAAASGDDLFRRICTMVPRGLCSDTREDVSSEIYLAVLEGRLSAEFSRADVSLFINRHLAEFRKFQVRSLDEVVVDGRRFGELVGVY